MLAKCGITVYAEKTLTECNVSDVITNASVRARYLHRWLTMREENLRCGVGCSATFPKLLHEYFAQYNVVVVFENRTKHNRHTIRLRLDVQSFLITIIDNSSLLAFQALLLEVEILLEHTREAVALQQADLLSNLFVVVRNVLEVDEDRDVEAVFRFNE